MSEHVFRQQIGIPVEDHLRALFDRLPVMVAQVDLNHVFHYANDYFCRWYGLDQERIISRQMREIIGPNDYQIWLPSLRRAEAGEEAAFDVKLPNLNGALQPMTIRYVPAWKGRQVAAIYVIAVDSQASTYRFEGVYEGSAVGFWEVDLTAINTLLNQLSAFVGQDKLDAHVFAQGLTRRALDLMPIVSANPKARSMLGGEVAEVVGRPLGHFVPPSSEPIFTANLLAYLRGQTNFEDELTLLKADGEPINVLFTGTFPKRGAVRTRAYFGAIDISRRVAQERRLATIETELTRAARFAMLGQLAGSIAHEVQQPLASVVTNSIAALRWLDRPEPNLKEVRRAVERTAAEGMRASNIIQKTRSLAVKGQPERIPHNINSLIREAVTVVHKQLMSIGVEYGFQLDPNLPDAEVDGIQIQQVVINLVVNAAQAMAAQKGKRRITLRTYLNLERIHVEVSDTGPGVDEDKLPGIFEAFYTTKSDGMGMGLPIAKTIVEAHGGTINASVSDTGGATFSFTVPVHHTHV
jgi:PAS domain S-box-containing protein